MDQSNEMSQAGVLDGDQPADQQEAFIPISDRPSTIDQLGPSDKKLKLELKELKEVIKAGKDGGDEGFGDWLHHLDDILPQMSSQIAELRSALQPSQSAMQAPSMGEGASLPGVAEGGGELHS